MPIEPLLQLFQAVVAVVSLYYAAGHRIAEQSSEGQAYMATKARVLRGNTSSDLDVQGDPKDLSVMVNEALKAGDKFITFTMGNGKDKSVIAERVVQIWEE